MQLVDPVDNVGLFRVRQDLATPGKDRLSYFRSITVEFKFLFECWYVADSGIGHGKENSKRIGGNVRNLLAKARDLLIPTSQKPELRSNQNSVYGGPKSR
jgi:hypothetical protein